VLKYRSKQRNKPNETAQERKRGSHEELKNFMTPVELVYHLVELGCSSPAAEFA
jgi:hypothetical protein